MAEEVNVRLLSGQVVLAQPKRGGWMGGTKERPYPDFEQVKGDAMPGAFGPTPNIDHNHRPCGCKPDHCCWTDPYGKGCTDTRVHVFCEKNQQPEFDPRHYRSDGQVRADQVFIATAFLMATRSTCTRGHVGAVAVQDRRIVATGYNGAPPGRPHCTDVGCDLSAGDEAGCQRSVHAEANLVAWAARAGVRLQGALVYATHSPCKKCAELLLSAGIAEFHYSKPYRLGEVGMLTQAGIYTMDHGGVTYWPGKID